MKVILKDNIENLGKKGDIVKVASGYGRNYLIPKGMALKVTATNMKMIEMVQKSLRKGLEKEMKVYQSLIEKLNAVSLTFTRKAGEKDAIFGSVSVTDIRDALAELGFDIEKKRILLAEPLKRLGNYTVPIKVFHDDRAEIKLEVAREAGPEETLVPEPEAAVALIATEAEKPEPKAIVEEPEPEPVAAEPEPEPVAAEPEPVTAEPEPVTAEPEPVTAEPEPVPETSEPDLEPDTNMPEPTAEALEPEKTEESPAEEPTPEAEAPAADTDTDKKS